MPALSGSQANNDLIPFSPIVLLTLGLRSPCGFGFVGRALTESMVRIETHERLAVLIVGIRAS